MSKTSKRKAFYVITTIRKLKKNVFKIGVHTGDIYKLISRYITHIPNLIIYYFQYLDDANYVESKLKHKFYDERIYNFYGNKSEWINIKYDKLYKSIKHYSSSNSGIIVDKHTNIDPNIIIKNKSERSKLIKSLQDLIDIEPLQDLVDFDVNDKTKINKCIKSIILYYSKKTLFDKAYDKFKFKFPFIKETRRLFKVLPLIEWLENELGINRFEFVKLEINDPYDLINKMMVRIDDFKWLSRKSGNNECTKNITNRINKLAVKDDILETDSDDKIKKQIETDKLKSISRIKKFCMDIINQFDDFYCYESKKIGPNKFTIYENFRYNKNTIINHAQMINYLNMDPDKFIRPMKKKLLVC